MTSYILKRVKSGNRVVVLCRDLEEARELEASISIASRSVIGREFKTIVLYYDEYEPFSNISPITDLQVRYLESLKRFIKGDDYDVIIVPIKVLVRRTIPIEVLRDNIINLKRGENIIPKDLVRRLLRAGYIRDNIVDVKGRFSLRGEVLDIFAVNQRFPVRIIMLGSNIEKMRYFDLESQRGFKEIDEYEILPVSEFMMDEKFKTATIEQIKSVASENLLSAIEIKKYVDDLNASFEYNLKMHFLPFMYDYRCSSIFDYMPVIKDQPADVSIICDSKRDLIAEITEYYDTIRKNYSELVRDEKVAPPFDSFIVDIQEVISVIERGVEPDENYTAPDVENLIAKFRLYLKKDSNISISDIGFELKKVISRYRRVILLFTEERQRDTISEILSLTGIAHSGREGPGPVGFVRGRTPAPFVVDDILFFPLNLILRERKIFDYEETAYDKIKMLRLKFSEIKVGDYVVHRDYGIGIYRGIKRISSDGGMQDYIVIEYRDNRLLYLPALNIDQISKYESGGARSIVLSPLKKEHWEKKKLKIKEELIKFASELLRVRAERRLIEKEKIDFSEELYERFCEGFEFVETPDQMRCIEEIKKDLLSPYPMERIVCGDVGFGKTEVILRAAFIVASSGYQVAVLVPTTILAEQHYETFRGRLKDFPLRVEMLSRFVPDRRLNQIIKDIRDGRVDIVIGTHKLLSSGVQFKRLQLLVIDEEHKFGVEQKERLKKENPALDILITTATPIPRSLNMGLSELVDLSILTTPPPGRIPVRTIIAKYDEEIIKSAIQKEIKRGGQVFFVHPRIKTIENVAKRIGLLIPSLRIAVVHGRMPSEYIEEVMHNFYEKRYDVLVSTNIIGAGLDIADVNTIIVDSADLFGLAELYQLRGRVGRRNVNAYAYFLLPSISTLKGDVKKKMDILYRHQGLGAGFNIASEDLELRGAGELLGKRQSGFIDAIGFDLYNELLQETIAELRGMPMKRLFDVEVRVDIPVYIPDTYIDDVSLRINFYHRFSAAMNNEAVDNLLAEMVDRFGDYPPEVENLAEISRIKAIARNMRIKGIDKNKNSISILFDPSAEIRPDKVIDFLRIYHKEVRITPDSRIVISLGNEIDLFSTLREWLERLQILF